MVRALRCLQSTSPSTTITLVNITKRLFQSLHKRNMLLIYHSLWLRLCMTSNLVNKKLYNQLEIKLKHTLCQRSKHFKLNKQKKCILRRLKRQAPLIKCMDQILSETNQISMPSFKVTATKSLMLLKVETCKLAKLNPAATAF